MCRAVTFKRVLNVESRRGDLRARVRYSSVQHVAAVVYYYVVSVRAKRADAPRPIIETRGRGLANTLRRRS